MPKKGYKQTEEHKKKLSKSNLGKKRTPFTEEHKKKISKALKGKNSHFYGVHLYGEKNGMYGKHHTEESKEKIRINLPNRLGKNNPNWKGGLGRVKTDNIISRNENKYLLRSWGKKVKERDGNCCQVCHQVDEKLNAHHIASFKDYPDKRFDVNNGITLCRDCHLWIHRLNPLDQQ